MFNHENVHAEAIVEHQLVDMTAQYGSAVANFFGDKNNFKLPGIGFTSSRSTENELIAITSGTLPAQVMVHSKNKVATEIQAKYGKDASAMTTMTLSGSALREFLKTMQSGELSGQGKSE